MGEQSKMFDLPSGARLAVTVAPFQDAMALLKECLKTLKGASFSKEDLGLDMAQVAKSPLSVAGILDRVVAFATSDGVEAALFRCFERATWSPPGWPEGQAGLKVSKALFDNAEHGTVAREDYAQIAARVVEVNCAPFLAKALSGFLTKPQTPAGSSAQGTRTN